MKQLTLIVVLCTIAIAPSNLHARSKKQHGESNLERTARIIMGTCSLGVGAFCFYRARPHVQLALYYANGYRYFCTLSNCWPLLKACWLVWKYGKENAHMAQCMPFFGDVDVNAPGSWYEQAVTRIDIADACLKAAPWLSAGASFTTYGLSQWYKALKRTKNKRTFRRRSLYQEKDLQ